MDTITRRRFLDRTGTYALGGLSARPYLLALLPNVWHGKGGGVLLLCKRCAHLLCRAYMM